MVDWGFGGVAGTDSGSGPAAGPHGFKTVDGGIHWCVGVRRCSATAALLVPATERCVSLTGGAQDRVRELHRGCGTVPVACAAVVLVCILACVCVRARATRVSHAVVAGLDIMLLDIDAAENVRALLLLTRWRLSSCVCMRRACMRARARGVRPLAS